MYIRIVMMVLGTEASTNFILIPNAKFSYFTEYSKQNKDAVVTSFSQDISLLAVVINFQEHIAQLLLWGPKKGLTLSDMNGTLYCKHSPLSLNVKTMHSLLRKPPCPFLTGGKGAKPEVLYLPWARRRSITLSG